MKGVSVSVIGLLLGAPILIGVVDISKAAVSGPSARKWLMAGGKPVGPYTPGVLVGNTLYASGQLGLDPKTSGLVEGGIKEQTRQALANLGRILEEAGLDYEHVVRATVYLTDINDFQEMNEVYATFFPGGHYPSRSTVAVAALARSARVEIDFVAIK